MRITRLLFLLPLLTGVGFGLAGCEEDTTQPPTDEDHAELLFVHAAPAGPGVDLWIGDETLLTDVSFGEFGDAYSEIDAGSQQVRIYPTGTSTTAVVDKTIEFTEDEHYTLFATNDAAGSTFGTVLFQDDLSEPADGKAHIRLANLVPDSSPISLAFAESGLGGPVIDDIEFMENSEFFQPVDAGAVKLRIQKAGSSGGGGGGGGGGGSNNNTVTEDLDFTLEEGGIYTVAVVGTVDATDDKDAQMVIIKHEEDH